MLIIHQIHFSNSHTKSHETHSKSHLMPINTVGPVGPTGPVGTALLPKGKLANLVRRIVDAGIIFRHLARRARVARRHVHDWVVVEKVPRLQDQRNRLHRHHGKVLGSREVDNSERVPKHDVGVVDGLGAIAHPLGDAMGRLARSLGDVAAGCP